MLSMVFSISGCAEIATTVVSNVGIQKAIDSTWITDGKAHLVCRPDHILQGKKYCRVKKTYRRV